MHLPPTRFDACGRYGDDLRGALRRWYPARRNRANSRLRGVSIARFDQDFGEEEGIVATARQRTAARRNVKKAAAAAKRKQTLKRLPKRTRQALGKEAATARATRRRRAA
jgi:hypothetical protein